MTQEQLAELSKTIDYIGRTSEKINDNTWSVYKEQILQHIKNAKYLLNKIQPVIKELEGRLLDYEKAMGDIQ
jgi:hypothetical protein